MSLPYPRALTGYGGTPPHAQRPCDARIAYPRASLPIGRPALPAWRQPLRPSRSVLYSPPGKRPNAHALPSAAPAAADLGIPAGTALIKALMRGILPAISAEAAEPLGSVAGKSCTAPSEVRPRRPISERGEQTLQSVWTNAAGGTAARRHPGQTDSIEKMTEGERQGSPCDHRVLLRGANIAASTMPAENAYTIHAFWCSTRIRHQHWIGQLPRP
jgi:hypothetical protein